MLSKILVATDGSDNSIRATEISLELAKLAGAEVTLIYVAYVPDFYKEDISSELMFSFIEDGKRILEDTKKVFTRANYSVSTKLIREEKPSEAICRIASDYDMIVIGTRGLHKKQEKALGSVSNAVAHCAICPVLLVK